MEFEEYDEEEEQESSFVPPQPNTSFLQSISHNIASRPANNPRAPQNSLTVPPSLPSVPAFLNYHLSWTDGDAFALVDGASSSQYTFLRWTLNESNQIVPDNPIDFLAQQNYFNRMRTKPKKTYDALRKIIVSQEGEVPPGFEQDYQRALTVLRERAGKEVSLSDGRMFRILPTAKEGKRDVLYLAGPPGQGKTYLSCQFLRLYERMWPTRKCFVFTGDERDPTILAQNLQRTEIISVDLKDKDGIPFFLKKQWTHESFYNCVVMFDDVDGMVNKQVVNALRDLMDKCLKMGRHTGTSVIITNHMLTEYQKTRQWIQQANWVVFFPLSAIGRNIEYFIRDYLGIKNVESQEQLMRMGRWVAVKTDTPQLALSDYKCILLSALKKTK